MNPTNNFRAPMMGETVWFVCKKCGHRFSEKTKKELFLCLPQLRQQSVRNAEGQQNTII